MKVEVECQCCHEKVRTENHCAIFACFNCGEWLNYPDGTKVNWEERHRIYKETYFGEDK